MRANFFIIFGLFFLAFFPASSYALTLSADNLKQTPSQFSQILGTYGVTYSLYNNNANVEVIGDVRKIINSLDALQKLGVITQLPNPTLLKQRPNYIANVILPFLFFPIILHLYQTTNADKVHFDVFLLTLHNTKIKLYSFDFNREEFNKTDWKNFDDFNYKKPSLVLLNLNYSFWEAEVDDDRP